LKSEAAASSVGTFCWYLPICRKRDTTNDAHR
jgi:hypothetical protein